ncbi:MAG TPA: hypothetical protein PLT03_03020 [Bacillota bacterium]|nr:hypothetical protein [Bacillota bacterium]HOA15482.1 hypothetical protein [Bacillota bacterium]HOG52824.1 hypothetical protein [Bacillota bacterium]
MFGSYWIGVMAAIAAGISFNLALLVQKLAVRKAADGEALMPQLLRSPLWLAGFSLQFFIGVPLNIVAQGIIGPAILPGLMAIGLVVLAIGASTIVGERFRRSEMLGIAFVMAAVTAFGFSRLSVDLRAVDLYEPAFLLRLGIFSTCVMSLSAACFIAQRRSARTRGILKTLNAGLLFSQSNLWLGISLALLARWSKKGFSAFDSAYLSVAVVIVLAGSILGVAETQGAMKFGDVSKLVPIQHIPTQILPILAYLTVFYKLPVAPSAMLLAVSGIIFVITGAILLARRQITGRKTEFGDRRGNAAV